MDPFNVAAPQLEQLISRLTPRQLQIVELLVMGYSQRYIASLLSISPETVKTHIHKMINKFEVENRIQIIVLYTVWKITNEHIEERTYPLPAVD